MPKCYLCGGEIPSHEKSKDHIPPKLIFAKEWKEKEKPSQFITKRVHVKCNEAYSKDETYFRDSVGLIAFNLPIGQMLFSDIKRSWKNSPMLFERIRAEFSKQDATKTIDNHRVDRILEKIIKGLYFHEYGKLLPSDTRFHHSKPWGEGVDIPMAPSGLFDSSKGKYPDVFDYCYSSAALLKKKKINMWATLFWGKVLTFTLFHQAHADCLWCQSSQ